MKAAISHLMSVMEAAAYDQMLRILNQKTSFWSMYGHLGVADLSEV